MNIEGKIVVITGASSGIGAATAKAMAHKAGCVLLLARTQAALEKVAAEIAAEGGTARPYPVDLADPQAVQHTANAIHREVGAPAIVVNNAGAGRWLFVEETDPAEAMQMMMVPYLAAFGVTHAFLPEMLVRQSGHIVNVTSVACYSPWPGATAYAAARWAMRGFTQALRADLYGTGVRVTLVAAGHVLSPYFEHNPGTLERIPRIARLYPKLAPEQVAEAIVSGVERNRREIVLPFSLWLTLLAHRILPGPIDGLVTRTGWKHART